MNKWELARRDLLRGLGLGVGCLPLLGASELWAAPSTAPRRLLIVMNTNGYRQAYWKPRPGDLMTQTLPDSCTPLERLKQDIIFCPDMAQPAYGGGGHGSYVSCLASGPNDNKGEYRVPFTPTIDQIVGPGLAQAANLSRATLPLGIQIAGGNAGIFPSKRMCWKDRNTPITPEENIYASYADVFAGKPGGAAGNDGAVQSLMAHKKSLLDYVGKSLERWKGRLGTDDRQVVDSHLQSVRDLENQLSTPRLDATQCGADAGMPLDVKSAGNYPTLFKLSLDLMVAAIRCDVTRVVTLAPCDASGSNISFKSAVPEANRGWHSMGHSPTSGGVDNKRFADKWLMGQFAALIDRLKAVPEPGGTLLDSTIVLWANHMEEGANHNSQKTPWMLAGNVDRYFKLGQCAPSTSRPVNGVLYHICHALGFPVEFVGTRAFGGGWDGLTA
jgi:hypothetical protein